MIELTLERQPDDETCGSTCLHAIYNYYNFKMSLNEVIDTVERSRSGGTLSPFLGKHALEHGFTSTIYVNNLDIFDPSWFTPMGNTHSDFLMKLETQLQHTEDADIAQSNQAYQAFIKLGGVVKFRTLNTQLLKFYFNKKIPILTGLSATYLYRCKRMRYDSTGEGFYDDIFGTPCGHFVVLCGYNDLHRLVVIADPARGNPLSDDLYYKVSSTRLINSIMLGVLTYDANLLIIEPKEGR